MPHTVLPKKAPIENAFAILRDGYPHNSFADQSHGKPFRDASHIITDALVEEISEKFSHISKEHMVVLMPWRAGLAFAKSFADQGIHRFYHVSARRNEKTLETIVDYEYGEIHPHDLVIVADPMLATGNTSMDSIQRIMTQGIHANHIVLTAIIAAPEGISAIHTYAPSTEMIIGMLDEKLDKNGFIVPGLGDFGDKYFTDMTEAELTELLQILNPSAETKGKLEERMRRHQEENAVV